MVKKKEGLLRKQENPSKKTNKEKVKVAKTFRIEGKKKKKRK